MSTVIVLPSGVKRFEFYGSNHWVLESRISFLCWPSILLHGNGCGTMGETSVDATNEALLHLQIDAPFSDTLSRGGVHHKREDPLNGFLEYTGGMSYNIWPWKVIISWLTYGWPQPTHDTADCPVGSWCWHDQPSALLPPFDKHQKGQLKGLHIPTPVIEGKRLLTEHEAVDVAYYALMKQRVKPRNKYFRAR